MKRIYPFLICITCVAIFSLSCNNQNASKGSNETDDSTLTAKANDSEILKKELEDAFKDLWHNVTLTNADQFFKTHVSDDFYTINADGIVQNKEELLADKKRLEMLEILEFKFFDQVIKSYGNVGIVNGRIQAFSEGNYVGEVLYTAIFVKENDIWKYKNWQGTWSIDSPPPPSFIPED